MRFAIGLALMISCAAPLAAQDFSLEIPLDCTLGEDQPCFIQNYVDSDPGPDRSDFSCQHLTYNGHKGTDFALRSEAELAQNVAVLAAAAGRVKGTRDGMVDRLYTQENAAELDGKDCGNGLVIDHGDGWETQYCHLKRGSLRVKRGDVVEAGDVLGAIGLSGRTQFPHLHLSVRRHGAPVDPFDPNDVATCGAAPKDTLWADDVAYQPGGLIAAGFSTGVPDYADVKSGTAHQSTISSDSPALVLWGFAFGSRIGDILRLRIEDDAGNVVFENDTTLTKAQAQFFRAGGRKTRNAAWFKTGYYTGTIEMIRDGRVISDTANSVHVTQ